MVPIPPKTANHVKSRTTPRKGPRPLVRRGIIIFTIAASAVSLVQYVLALTLHTQNPLWNRVLITYSLVFWVFLAFDEFGREMAAHGAAKRAQAPKGRPMPLGGANMVFAPGEILPSRAQAEPAPRLVRMASGTQNDFSDLAVDCAKELHALLNESISGEQALKEFPVRGWLLDESIFPFFVELGGDMAGVIAAKRTADDSRSGFEVVLLYVLPSLRRRGIGGKAVEALRDFLQLLGESGALSARVSTSNLRAVRFFEKVGVSVVTMPDSSAKTSTAASPVYSSGEEI